MEGHRVGEQRGRVASVFKPRVTTLQIAQPCEGVDREFLGLESVVFWRARAGWTGKHENTQSRKGRRSGGKVDDCLTRGLTPELNHGGTSLGAGNSDVRDWELVVWRECPASRPTLATLDNDALTGPVIIFSDNAEEVIIQGRFWNWVGRHVEERGERNGKKCPLAVAVGRIWVFWEQMENSDWKEVFRRKKKEGECLESVRLEFFWIRKED